MNKNDVAFTFMHNICFCNKEIRLTFHGLHPDFQYNKGTWISLYLNEIIRLFVVAGGTFDDISRGVQGIQEVKKTPSYFSGFKFSRDKTKTLKISQ